MPTVDVHGTNLGYEVHGTGEQVVVVHGLAADISESGATTKPWRNGSGC